MKSRIHGVQVVVEEEKGEICKEMTRKRDHLKREERYHETPLSADLSVSRCSQMISLQL